MAMTRYSHLARQVARTSRDVTVGVLSAVWPGMSDEDVAAWLAERPHPGRIIAATLSALLALSIAFAQFGFAGLIAFLVVVMIAVR